MEIHDMDMLTLLAFVTDLGMKAWGQVLNCESTQLPYLTRVYN